MPAGLARAASREGTAADGRGSVTVAKGEPSADVAGVVCGVGSAEARGDVSGRSAIEVGLSGSCAAAGSGRSRLRREKGVENRERDGLRTSVS